MSDSLRPMDYSQPGSSVHGIFQARVLEWDAIAFSEETGHTSPIHNVLKVVCWREKKGTGEKGVRQGNRTYSEHILPKFPFQEFSS